MSDKVIGFLMVLGSLAVVAFLLIWTIIMPFLDPNFLFKAYIALAIIVFLAVFAAMIIVAWIGVTLIKTSPPEEILDELEENKETEEESKNENESEEK